MKRMILLTVAVVLLAVPFAQAEKLVVGATPVPHAEILEKAKPLLAKLGYELEIREFTDYVMPNLALEDGDLDANFFQHVPYLNEFNKNKSTNLVATVGVHIEPMAVYSKKYKKLADLPKGAVIAVPNDPTNESRALDVLAAAGLLKLDAVDMKTKLDIAENPNKFDVKELDAPQLPRVLDDVDAAVINTNYALPAGLNPVRDALAIESKDSPYANIIAVHKKNKDSAKTKALNSVLNSAEIREFIRTQYKGAIVEAF